MKHLFLLASIPLLLWTGLARAQDAPPALRSTLYISPAGTAPDWSRLDSYQRTITRADFLHEWNANYCGAPDASASPLIQVLDDRALIVKQFKRPNDVYELFFAESLGPPPPARTWRGVQELPPPSSPNQPLDGVRIAIDPGHIGGDWARMEQRWFFIPPPPEVSADSPENQPVKEGEIVLRVAEILDTKLTQLGARVSLVRRQLEPVTSKRPRDFVEAAHLSGNFPPGSTLENNRDLAAAAERLFCVNEEIRARSRKINEAIKPDLVLCLHVNAEGWGDPGNPSFVPSNHFHMLINGTYSEAEIAFDDQRFELILRLLQRMHPEELSLATTVAGILAETTGLPPYIYPGSNARRAPISEYVWSRNLLATRVYECPVIFFEPYVMNHEVTYTRVQAGEYPGVRDILGKPYPNIYQEYADGVANGLETYFRNHRRPAPANP